MAETIYSGGVRDGYMIWDKGGDVYTSDNIQTTSRIGNSHSAELDTDFHMRSFLSFDTSAFTSISDWEMYIYVDKYIGSAPSPFWGITGVGGDDSFIGAELDDFDWGCCGTNGSAFFFPISGTGWKSTSWKNLAMVNPGGFSDHELRPVWGLIDGETHVIVIRQSEYGSGTDKTYDPYMTVTGVLKDRRHVTNVRLAPRVNRVRPASIPRRVIL